MHTKLILSLLLVILPLCTIKAIMKDSLYIFRFVPEKDIFYVPYRNNGTQLEKLSELVEQHREAILNGEISIQVEGYCSSKNTMKENLQVSVLRSNRVKSELIVKEKLTENCFLTRNHTKPYGNIKDIVIVSLRLPEPKAIITSLDTVKTEIQEKPEQKITADTSIVTPVTKLQETSEEIFSEPERKKKGRYTFALRTNLLHLATLTPDLGLEWRANSKFGILVNGSWTSWSWQDKNRRYALWKVSPEMRLYIGKEHQGYLGVMYHIGQFNYKLSDIGKQGDYQGGGLTGGWQLPLNHSLSLDFHIGLGYTYADYEKYNIIENTRIRQGNSTKNYWGINQIGITLQWKLGQ